MENVKAELQHKNTFLLIIKYEKEKRIILKARSQLDQERWVQNINKVASILAKNRLVNDINEEIKLNEVTRVNKRKAQLLEATSAPGILLRSQRMLDVFFENCKKNIPEMAKKHPECDFESVDLLHKSSSALLALWKLYENTPNFQHFEQRKPFYTATVYSILNLQRKVTPLLAEESKEGDKKTIWDDLFTKSIRFSLMEFAGQQITEENYREIKKTLKQYYENICFVLKTHFYPEIMKPSNFVTEVVNRALKDLKEKNKTKVPKLADFMS